METDLLTLELITLLKATLPNDRVRVDDSMKRRRSRIGVASSKMNRFSYVAAEPRTRLSARSRVKAGAHTKLVFASPRFSSMAPTRPKVFDESAADQDAATVVTVVESFNPYTSLESGSYCGTTYVPIPPPRSSNKRVSTTFSRPKKQSQISDLNAIFLVLSSSSNDDAVDEVVNLVTIMHVEEIETSMPYIS